MKRNWLLRGLRFVLFVTIAIAVAGQAVLQLWNWLMPSIFGLHTISFWQAVGLLALSWILFGRFRGGRSHGMHLRWSMRERWEQMTPEQRDKFRKGLQGRCGHFEPPAAEPKA